MRFFAKGEYRGKESKTSAKGNPYFQLIFEDPDSGEQLRSYAQVDSKFDIALDKLVKGTIYGLYYHYHYDYGKWQLNLVNIKPIKEG